jgi:hypothetical protein
MAVLLSIDPNLTYSTRDQSVHLFGTLPLPNLSVLHVDGGFWPLVEDFILHYDK